MKLTLTTYSTVEAAASHMNMKYSCNIRKKLHFKCCTLRICAM